MPITDTTPAAAINATMIPGVGPSIDSVVWWAFHVSQHDHKLAAIHNATRGDIHRITYSKNGPKMRIVEIRPRMVAADSTANSDSSTRSRRLHAHHADTPTRSTNSPKPT